MNEPLPPQTAEPPAEQATLDSGRVLGLVKRILANGWLVPQPAWTALAYTNGWGTATVTPGYPALAYRLILPTGQIAVRGGIAGGAYATVAATLPSSYWPTNRVPIVAEFNNGSTWGVASGEINTSGQILLLVAVPSNGVFNFYVIFDLA